MSRLLRISSIVLGFVVAIAPVARAAIVYTSDSNVADFTGLVSSYATFSNYSGGDVAPPFTPTSTEIKNNGFRVYGGGTLTGLPGSDWILATFTSPTSNVLIFPNIDHFGAGFDGYQYTIEGSNDLTAWTPLFDALTAVGAGEPFTLGTFTGTAPSTVNNVLTPGAGPAGTVGYEAQFSFGTAYKYYAFGASTLAVNSGNADQELSAVGAVGTVPEPGSMLLLGTSLLVLGAGVRRKVFRR